MTPRTVVLFPLAYSPEEAAEATGLSVATIYRLMERGELPFEKVGRNRLIGRTALQRLVDPLALEQSALVGDARDLEADR